MKRPIVTRRDTLKGMGGVAAAASSARLARGAPGTRPPSIVFIMADDLGYADLSCYGRPDFQTPNIDRLAADGLRFLQAYANSAVCSATRTALITGRYQYRLRVGLEEPIAGGAAPNVGLPPDVPTLPSLLKKAGYATALVGKWHLGLLPTYGPLKSGYDHFFGFRSGAVDYFTHASGGEEKEDLWDDDRPIHDPRYLTSLLGAHAEHVIDTFATTGQPFLLSLHFNAPHWPWEGPQDQAESIRIHGKLRDYDGGSQKTFGAMVTAMDAEVGKVLAALERNGLTNDTIVIFTSDNGGERFADTWPFSGQKTELLEGGLRIPAIIRWPGVTPRGSLSEQPIITMDWLPTLLAAAGTTPDPALPSDGIDLAPFIRGGAPIPRKFFWRYKGNRQRAVREGDFKYLKILDNTFLFNVVEDPRERANLKGRHADVYQRLVADWHVWNKTMLPEVDESFTDNVTGQQQADHIGTPPTNRKADSGLDD
jgi:arylsulfatase A-like enzyme